MKLRDLLESDEFKNHPSKIAFATGRDIGGKVVVSDIQKMPHVLIAGATGSGKSVCINTLITSIIYKAKPKYIDPKTTDFDQDVYLPQILLDPLLNYVTYKIYLGLGGENVQLAQGYQQLYEKLCNDVAINNLLNDHSTVTNIKFVIRGFV